MPEVIVRKGEPIDRALKRLKSKLDTEGIMDEIRRLRAFETPTQRTKRKAKANAKRAKAKFRFSPTEPPAGLRVRDFFNQPAHTGLAGFFLP